MADKSHDCSEIARVSGSTASTSSSSDRFIININSGNQGDVVTGVGGDVIMDVGGDVFKDVYVGGDFIYGDKKKLPPTPPRFVVLIAKYNGKCLRLTENDDGDFGPGFLKFDGRGRDLASPQAKFELVTAKSGHEFVHIRCCYNNKYWVRSGTTGFIVAAADKTEEDQYKISCTLFELEQVKKSGRLEFRFRHSQRETYACFWRCWNSGTEGIQRHGGLCVGTNANDAYTVVAWESLEKINEAVVQLPKFVALKGLMESHKYLSLTTKNDPCIPAGFLQLEGNEVASLMTKFRIEMAKSIENGFVHIRCCDNNKYLVRENTTHICDSCGDKPYLIVAAADKPEEDENKISSTLFKPEPYDESGEPKFRFWHVHLGMRRYACMDMFTPGLYGVSNEPNKDACDVYGVVDLDGLG